MFTVYVLYSEKYNLHYKGFTSNIAERLNSHNELGKDWTKKYRPWRMIYKEEFETRKEALIKEKWLKSGVGRDFIKSLPH